MSLWPGESPVDQEQLRSELQKAAVYGSAFTFSAFTGAVLFTELFINLLTYLYNTAQSN